MADNKQGISLILPAYNEESTILEMTREAVRVLEESGRDYEVIIVDDGSTDSTPEEISKAVSQFQRVMSLTLPENQGKGHAWRRGFQISRKELVCFIDADLDLHPSQLKELVAAIESSGADIVIGSKRHPDSVVAYPWYRKLYSTVYYMLTLLLFRLPVKDTQTGIKVFKREVLTRAFPRIVSRQYTLDLELLAVAHRMGYTVYEAPVRLDFEKKYGRIRWTDARNIVLDTMRIFYRLSFLRYYDSPLKPAIDDEPYISIVIPAKDYDLMLDECLRKCCGLNYSRFDIKLVPDYPVEADLPPLHIDVIPSGPVGPSIKRNIGVADSNADIVAFIDADAWPDIDWLKNAIPYFEDGEVAAVCGPAVTPANDSPSQQVSGLIYSSSLVSGNTTYRYLHHALREVDDYPSCNLLVRRSDFDMAGGFPEEFWPGEDTVLCHRLTQDLGKKIIYVPNVTIFHHRRGVYLPHLRQVYAYARHRGYFARKFPETSRRLKFFVPSLFLISIIIGFGLSFFFPLVFYIYISVLGFYVLLSFISSMKSLDPLINLRVFPGIMATNIVYGIGFLKGLLTRRMERS